MEGVLEALLVAAAAFVSCLGSYLLERLHGEMSAARVRVLLDTVICCAGV